MLFLAGLGQPIVWVTFPNLPPGLLVALVFVLWGLAILASKFSGKSPMSTNRSKDIGGKEKIV